MRVNKTTRTFALTALVVAAMGTSRAGAQEGATLAALKVAYQREVNVQWHYLAFADAAAREGHPEIASVFRAVARGEEIHAANHMAQIERLGDQADPRIESVVVRTTAENLAAAIGLERAEQGLVYPALGRFARSECDYDALASLNYAKDAEGTHAAMFADALERLLGSARNSRLLASLVPVSIDDAQGPAAFVCSGCGSVFHSRPGRFCPNCGTTCSTMIVFP